MHKALNSQYQPISNMKLCHTSKVERIRFLGFKHSLKVADNFYSKDLRTSWSCGKDIFQGGLYLSWMTTEVISAYDGNWFTPPDPVHVSKKHSICWCRLERYLGLR